MCQYRSIASNSHLSTICTPQAAHCRRPVDPVGTPSCCNREFSFHFRSNFLFDGKISLGEFRCSRKFMRETQRARARSRFLSTLRRRETLDCEMHARARARVYGNDATAIREIFGRERKRENRAGWRSLPAHYR